MGRDCKHCKIYSKCIDKFRILKPNKFIYSVYSIQFKGHSFDALVFTTILHNANTGSPDKLFVCTLAFLSHDVME